MLDIARIQPLGLAAKNRNGMQKRNNGDVHAMFMFMLVLMLMLMFMLMFMLMLKFMLMFVC